MNRGELEAALTMRQEREVFEIVNRAVLAVEDELRGPLELVLAATFAASGGNAAKRLARIVSRTALRAAADFEFDAKNKRAQRWVEEHATDLIRGISKTSRERIKDLLSDAFDGDMTVSDVADEIAEELGDDARAETIARTEAARAANAGQVEAWDQAVEEGLLTGQEKKEWITTPDDRLCPICEPMDGVQVDLDEDFNVDGERMSEPPAHPNCRCTIGIVLAN
jgi:SPP1 gp7 family putative phage head morphogenesis protein